MCKTCPLNGHCDDNGKLTCNTGFIREGKTDECVENQIIRNQSLKILKNFERQLQEQLGEYQCGKETAQGIAGQVFMDQLTQAGQDLYADNRKGSDELIEKVFELLNELIRQVEIDIAWAWDSEELRG